MPWSGVPPGPPSPWAPGAVAVGESPGLGVFVAPPGLFRLLFWLLVWLPGTFCWVCCCDFCSGGTHAGSKVGFGQASKSAFVGLLRFAGIVPGSGAPGIDLIAS